MLHWSLLDDTFCTVGPKTVFFWSLSGNKKKQRGSFGSPDKMTNLVCVTYDEKGIAYTGGQNGCIYKWSGSSVKSTHKVHEGVIHSIRYVLDPKDKSSLLLSGGSDFMIQISNPKTMVCIK